jgi:hypothetical protein
MAILAAILVDESFFSVALLPALRMMTPVGGEVHGTQVRQYP